MRKKLVVYRGYKILGVFVFVQCHGGKAIADQIGIRLVGKRELYTTQYLGTGSGHADHKAQGQRKAGFVFMFQQIAYNGNAQDQQGRNRGSHTKIVGIGEFV